MNEQYRSREQAAALAEKIRRVYPGGRVKLMEVCGTHTMAIARYALRDLLPEGLELVSGPGCPVCVTPVSVLDAALELAREPEVAVATFGDMMRVPGSQATLERIKAEGADVRMIYSAFQLLDAAEAEPETRFVFISVGFETTAPGTALCVEQARSRGLRNLFFIPANRLIIPALHALCGSSETDIHGFLCPGHVSVIIGWGAYREIADAYGVPCVVAGFEPVDILLGVYELVRRAARGEAGVCNAYPRAVTEQGNREARRVIDRVFRPVDASWRGIGTIPASGLGFRDEYEDMDALRHFDLRLRDAPEPPGCRCGDVLRGVIAPARCPLFGRRCTPADPVGPCMVSSEGSCAASFRYGDRTEVGGHA